MGITEAQAITLGEIEAHAMTMMQCYIGVRAGSNSYENSDVPQERMKTHNLNVMEPVHDRIRVPKTRWVVLRYPTPSMAQMAGMSTEAFERYYFDVCCLDYGKMERAMQPLMKRMTQTDKVRITGVGTDLRFSIKGMPALPCAGALNIPDGEIYSAPIRDSVNGEITFNTPTVMAGITYENVRLVFRDGQIIEATANHTERLNQELDTDEGARYVGEFALGVNPYITSAMKDTLFDEKIAGSFHFTPGSCYDECDNGNKSAIHWDMVCIQTPQYGGGEIWFDNELIRKDGRFVPESLQGLNPENLV